MYLSLLFLIYFISKTNGSGSVGSNGLYDLVFNAVLEADVSEECRKSLNSYVKNLKNSSNNDQWAEQMLDASSKTPSGLLSYNVGEMGNFDQCIETKSKYSDIKGKYCLTYITQKSNNTHEISKPIDMDERQYFDNIFQNIFPEIYLVGSPTWAVCLPNKCSDEDILNVLSNSNFINFNISSLSCQTEEDVNQVLRPEAIVAIFILSVLIYLVAVSTLYDYFCEKMQKPTIPLLIIFSIHSNGKGLFTARKNPNSLECLNGIRVFSMFWIILLHTFSVYGSGPLFNGKSIISFKDSWLSMIVYGGDIACDTFLLVGGLLVTYSFFKGKIDKKFNVLEYYIHRYFRIAPTLAGAVLISATLLRYMGSGPKWDVVINNFEGFCKQNWWSSMLFVQNYVSLDKLCVGHSWYLNVDMQLYILSPIFLMLLHKYLKTGIMFIVLLCFASISYGFYIAFEEELSGVSTNFYTKGDRRLYTNDFYLQTHTRASPWLIGLILGYVLVKGKSPGGNFKIIAKVLWLICLCILGACLFSGYPTLRTPNYNRLGNSFFIALSRPVWSLCVSWIIWACANNHGGFINTILSLPVFQILGRFTYSMYIIHVTLLYMIVFGQKVPIYFGVFNLVYNYFAISSFVFCISVVWVLVFEIPMLKLEKILFSKK